MIDELRPIPADSAVYQVALVTGLPPSRRQAFFLIAKQGRRPELQGKANPRLRRAGLRFGKAHGTHNPPLRTRKSAGSERSRRDPQASTFELFNVCVFSSFFTFFNRFVVFFAFLAAICFLLL
jgi:hypothetical protein